MKRRILIALLLLGFFSVMKLRASEDNPVSTSDREYFEQVRKAILTDDITWISKQWKSSPFNVNLKKRHLKIRNTSDLKRHFQFIFNSKLKEAVRNQSPNTLFKNWEGLMIGNGEVWFAELGEIHEGKTIWKYSILAINVPETGGRKP